MFIMFIVQTKDDNVIFHKFATYVLYIYVAIVLKGIFSI